MTAERHPEKLDGQGVYRMVRDAGCKVELITRMKGVSLRVTDPARPGEFAEAFGYYGVVTGDRDGEMAAWEALAETWNQGDFWVRDPDASDLWAPDPE